MNWVVVAKIISKRIQENHLVLLHLSRLCLTPKYCSQMLYKIVVWKNFTKLTEQNPALECFSSELEDLVL